jgi:hypothetical protein
MANPRIKRDLDDRLAERVAETKERISNENPDVGAKKGTCSCVP